MTSSEYYVVRRHGFPLASLHLQRCLWDCFGLLGFARLTFIAVGVHLYLHNSVVTMNFYEAFILFAFLKSRFGF